MSSFIYRLFIISCIFILVSCGGKDKKSTDPAVSTTADTAGKTGTSNLVANETADRTLAPVRSFIEKGLDKWAQSFKGFNTDSFHMTQKTAFGDELYEDAADLGKFYELYKASLIFSPDSTQSIDLYSAGIMLEKKGKKIIASADVDQAITL
ncbi:MAG TPA: hypothetical protein VGO58_10155 [Chitinophagaceae bacterium]|nr:hypothetical protein [Chitinophagaceae bacterium]